VIRAAFPEERDSHEIGGVGGQRHQPEIRGGAQYGNRVFSAPDRQWRSRLGWMRRTRRATREDVEADGHPADESDRAAQYLRLADGGHRILQS
jgi:hypothetical protein